MTRAQATTACADACVSESDNQLPTLRKHPHQRGLRRRLRRERILSWHTDYDANITPVCAEAYQQCESACQELADRRPGGYAALLFTIGANAITLRYHAPDDRGSPFRHHRVRPKSTTPR